MSETRLCQQRHEVARLEATKDRRESAGDPKTPDDGPDRPGARHRRCQPQLDAGEKVSVVICGSGRYLQVWNKADYDARYISARQQF
ncbi:MAG TPA: hypothetical protein PLV41_11200, partial [Miltoncostaeales bacterium]|nr:hypothetical protein [Miltoncostaeales bacterium]